tara:strand:+ start:755 stop:1000 length:246 start_codon:yes stop_codon:yes gene_type:complete
LAQSVWAQVVAELRQLTALTTLAQIYSRPRQGFSAVAAVLPVTVKAVMVLTLALEVVVAGVPLALPLAYVEYLVAAVTVLS